MKFLFWVPFLPSPSHILEKYLVHEQILGFEGLHFYCAWDSFLGETDTKLYTQEENDI